MTAFVAYVSETDEIRRYVRDTDSACELKCTHQTVLELTPERGWVRAIQYFVKTPPKEYKL